MAIKVVAEMFWIISCYKTTSNTGVGFDIVFKIAYIPPCCKGISKLFRAVVHSTQYTVHNTQYTVHNTQYTVHSTQYTVQTLHIRRQSDQLTTPDVFNILGL